MEASAVDLSAVRLHTIFEDGDFVLCRSRDARDTTSPSRSVLVLMPRSEHPQPRTVQMLEHEYSLRDALDPVWAVRSVALTTYEGRAALVLEDPGGELLVQRAGTPMDLGDVLRTGAGVAAALRHLHARGLIHKDLKPANVMIDSSTGQVWLRGFGIASRLPRERRAPEPPEVIAGTLAYMAPEQTGWMNRSIDARSDLYALGVVLYELSTGSLPFTASDAMGWVHGHIAQRPVPPDERQQDTPDVVAAIVMKLLAKTAEDRYQTAAAVERDLRRCLAHFDAERRIDAFTLGEGDTPDRLVIPEKLYGRARAIDTLLGAFERVVASGTPELVLVSGYSGIGKSSVVNELHRVLVPPRGLFASGKFDQYQRNIPYATLAQAFQTLVRSLLGKTEPELAVWRTALREAFGPDGRLIVDVVSELRLIVGEPPPVPELPAQQAQRRFQLVFRRFVNVFARWEHPLALVVDDLQWIDPGTLDVLEDLLIHGDVQHLLVIGAYRDNEVDANHPLIRRMHAIRQAGTPVHEISLSPLARADVQQLVIDALGCERVRADSLAQLIHHETGGNPFFLIQFLHALADERLLTFDDDSAEWSWDVDRIRAKGYTDNVVDLMLQKLRRLSQDTQSALQQLSCLGHRADIAMLVLLFGTSEEQIHASLWEAVRLGLVERAAGSYQFAHDRIQEAAYSLMPEDSRPAAHLRIGQLLAARTPPDQRDEAIFDIANQLNRGAALITEQEERERLAELNLMAGTRARNSTAYASALTYLLAGAALLAEDCWERQHALAFSIELRRAECEFLTGDSAAADRRLSGLSERARRLVDLATVTRLKEELFTTLGWGDRAVEACLDYLRHTGVQWSPQPTKEQVQREYECIWRQIGNRSIEELVDLPLMTEPELRGTIDVLNAVLAPASWTNENLFCLVLCRMATLSLEHGHSDGSCFAYVCLGMLLGHRFGNYPAGFSFGKLGLDLVEQRGLRQFEGRVDLNFGGCLLPWTQPIRTGRSLVRRAFEAATRLGDLTYAGYSRTMAITDLLATGEPLGEVQREAEAGLEFARQVRFDAVADGITGQLRLIRTLRGLTPQFVSFNDAEFDESRFEQHLAEDPGLRVVACWYWIRKLQARFLAGAYASAVEAAENARRLLGMPTTFELADYQLYAALARAALCDVDPAAERARHHEALAAHHLQLREWAESCPANFEDRAALVGAEVARVEGRVIEAERLYEQAIRAAREQGFVQNEGLAYELAARFYAARGFEPFADLYRRNARHCYRRWGADGKVRQLDELYPRLRQDEPAPDSRATIAAPVEQLELATVLKVSQAVSGEIVLDKLVDTVLRTAIAHAGAERGVLIVPRGDDLWIQADTRATGSAIAVAFREAPISTDEVPESIVRYAARSHECVSLDDASAPGAFSNDTYVRREQSKSVLCLPLLQHGQMMALLYLENHLAAGVFTPARRAVLNVVASQAAMSLEKAQLYRELQKREAKIRRLVDANIVGIITYDRAWRIIDANDAFLRIVGYERDDFSSGRLGWMELTPPEWREQDLSVRAPALQTFGSLPPYEKELFRKDGSRVPVLIGAASFDDDPSGGIAFVLDLTDRQRAEAAQKRAEADLRQAQTALAHRQRISMLGEVAASLAHEIRQPIAALTIDATACLRALGDIRLDVPEARRAASRIVKEATWADDIISRTSALYRKDTTQRERLDVNAVIRDMAVLLQHEAAASPVAIRTALADGLPEVIADRVQLQQVLMNLMLNGIEAMKETGGDLTIASAMREPGEVLISVSDTGVGLPLDTPGTIFDAFVTTKPHGTGLGLAITRSIVDAHGGRLWAGANTGPGATFLFTLPIDAAEHQT